MGGRHAGSRRRRTSPQSGAMLVFALLAGLTAGAYFGYQQVRDSGSSCETRAKVEIAVSPEIERAASNAAERAALRNCIDYAVVAATSADVALSFDGEPEDQPDAWIPDSTSWLTRVASTGAAPSVITESTASTPVGLVRQSVEEADLRSWSEALANPGFVSQDPARAAGAVIALVAAQTEADQGVTDHETARSTLVALAQRYGTSSQPDHAQDVINEVAANGGVGVVTAVDFSHASDTDGLETVMPATGTMSLDFPLLLANPDAQQAVEQFAAELSSSQGYEDLLADGFNVPPSAVSAAPANAIAAAQDQLSNTDTVNELMARWRQLVLPGRALVVVDVSGSMAFAAAESTRIDLITGSLRLGLDALPDHWAIGGWAFSQNLEGDQDWRELAPIRQLGSEDNGVGHRELLEEFTEALPTLVGQGTGLYATVLGATRAVREHYDPDAVNTVILLTDGANDDEGSISLEELLSALQAEADPERPVEVITIGISVDADVDVLEQIADASGGHSYIARDPEEIRTVFLDAVGLR